MSRIRSAAIVVLISASLAAPPMTEASASGAATSLTPHLAAASVKNPCGAAHTYDYVIVNFKATNLQAGDYYALQVKWPRAINDDPAWYYFLANGTILSKKRAYATTPQASEYVPRRAMRTTITVFNYGGGGAVSESPPASNSKVMHVPACSSAKGPRARQPARTARWGMS